VRAEAGSAVTVAVKPDTRSRGLPFEPGQFAWIRSRNRPVSRMYHPFSFSSSAERPLQLEFTIKGIGQGTVDMQSLQQGDMIYLEGPCGAFTLSQRASSALVFIGAGVGVAPLLGMLETLADRGDQRPCLLVLGNRDDDSITAADQLDALTRRLPLDVVNVLSRPSRGWSGERGRISAGTLDRCLPPTRRQVECFVCGPPAMIDDVVLGLIQNGVRPGRIHSECFDLV
jgi:ferredoxin-NADP reductase